MIVAWKQVGKPGWGYDFEDLLTLSLKQCHRKFPVSGALLKYKIFPTIRDGSNLYVNIQTKEGDVEFYA